MIRFPIFACLLLALAGCGFHLRGAVRMPADLGQIRVGSADAHSQLANALAQALSRNGIAATSDGATGDGQAALDIRYERWGDRASAVDEFGRAQEFTLRYATAFTLKRSDGSLLVPEQTIELARDYVSVPTESSGTPGERELLVRELQREMVAAIMRRLETVANAPAPAASKVIAPP